MFDGSAVRRFAGSRTAEPSNCRTAELF